MKSKVAGFYAARSRTIPPLPWPTFAPPFSVNLVHIADECCAVRGDPASTCRRLQRFFQHVALPQDWATPMIARFAGGAGKRRLVVERTNWKVGATDIKRLVPAIRPRHSQVPLLRTVLEKAGSSDMPERLERSIAAFAQDRIAMLLADREFIGCDGFNYLVNKNIPFTKSVRAARTALGNAAPPRKTHGNLAKPCFKTGFTFIRSRLRSGEPDVIIAWVRLKLSVQKAGVVSCENPVSKNK